MYTLMLFFFILLSKGSKGAHFETKRKSQHSNFLQQKNALLPNILPKCWISYIPVQYGLLFPTSSFSWVYHFISCTNVVSVYILYSQYNEIPLRVGVLLPVLFVAVPLLPEIVLSSQKVSSMCWNNQLCVYIFLLPPNQNKNVMLLKSPIASLLLSS